jgi:hypothetical protein
MRFVWEPLTKAGDGIPALRHWETFDIAPMARTNSDVVQAFVPLLIKPGVQETKRGLSTRKQSVVDEGEDASGQRTRRRGTRNGSLGAIPKVRKVETLGGKIRVPTTLLVVQTLIKITE